MLSALLSVLLLACTSTVTPQPVVVTVDGSYAWSYLNQATGQTAGSDNRASYTSTIESMIKPWIAADYLRRVGDPSTYRLAELSRMIRDSDDNAAEDIYRRGGRDSVVRRMVTICGMAHTRIVSEWWSLTSTTPDDAAQLGRCLADGRAAGPRWTDWLLSEMRQVRGTVDQQAGATGGGRWGIVDGLPYALSKDTAIKNGWTIHGGEWRVNCLAVHPDFVLVIMLRYPKQHGLAYGAELCEAISWKLVRRPHPVRYF